MMACGGLSLITARPWPEIEGISFAIKAAKIMVSKPSARRLPVALVSADIKVLAPGATHVKQAGRRQALLSSSPSRRRCCPGIERPRRNAEAKSEFIIAHGNVSRLCGQ